MKNYLLLSPLFFILFLLAATPRTLAQTGSIAGTVVDATNGNPLEGAHVMIDGTTIGVSVDSDGGYRLESVPVGNHILLFQYLGYTTQRHPVIVRPGETAFLNIKLQPEHLEMENLVIYGDSYIAGRDTSINREIMAVLPAISRVSSYEIKRQGAVTLTDAIKHVPGGWIETRGRKTKQFFSVRGQRYPYPDYSVNGIWQREFEETGYFISALDIESIEVVRSGSALVKGLSGLTGVVDIITSKPERETFSAMAKYGEQNSYVTNLRYGNRRDQITYNFSTSFFGTGGPPGRDGKERIANFHGTLDWDINDAFTLNTGAIYISGMRQFVRIVEPGSPNFLNRQEKFDPIHTILTFARVHYLGSDGSLTELQTNLTYRITDFHNHNLVNQTTSINSEDDYEYGFNLLHNRALTSTNTLRVGVLYNHWVAPEGKRFYAGRRGDVHTWSGVIANEQRVGRFSFDAGFRLIGGYIVEWGGFGIEGSAAGFQNVAPIENESVPLEWQSALGASWLLPGPYSLHYNFSGGSIAPRRGSLDGEGLRPEYEMRFQHDLGLLYRSVRRNEFSVSAFFTQRQNALDFSGETVTTEQDFLVELYENLDKRTYGVELSAKWNIPQLHSYLFANSTFMKGQNEINGRMETDEKIPNVILNLGILFDYAGFDLNLYAHHTGPYVNNRFIPGPWIAQHGDYPLGDFLALDITAGYTIMIRNNFSARVFAELKNVLDERYETVAAYPDPGRLFHAGIRVDL